MRVLVQDKRILWFRKHVDVLWTWYIAEVYAITHDSLQPKDQLAHARLMKSMWRQKNSVIEFWLGGNSSATKWSASRGRKCKDPVVKRDLGVRTDRHFLNLSCVVKMSVVDLNEKRCHDCGLFLPCHCKIDKKDFFGVEHHEEQLEEPVVILHKRQKRYSYPMPGTDRTAHYHQWEKQKHLTRVSITHDVAHKIASTRLIDGCICMEMYIWKITALYLYSLGGLVLHYPAVKEAKKCFFASFKHSELSCVIFSSARRRPAGTESGFF